MATPVTIVASGGLAVTDTGAANALPMSPMANGTPVTVVSSGGLPVCFVDDDGAVIGSETVSLLSSMTVAPSQARASLISDTIAALKAADLWDDLDVLYILAAHDAQAARLNWKAPGSFAATVVGSPTFAADEGYTGNGTNGALNTTFTPSTNAVQMTLNAAHVSVWTLSTAVGRDYEFLLSARNVAATSFTEMTLDQALGVTYERLNHGLGSHTTPVDASGMFLLDRTNATTAETFHNDASLGTITGSAVALPDRSIYLLARRGGTPDLFSTMNAAAFTAGAALGATKRTALYGILQDYLQAVGAVA